MTDQDIEAAKSVTADDVGGFLEDWQQGRCAGCGSRRGLVLDHDHDTGLVRGILCGSCNVREAYASKPDDPMFVYRERNPASMLGISVLYWSPIYGWAQPAPARMPIEDDPAYLVADATDRRHYRSHGSLDRSPAYLIAGLFADEGASDPQAD